MDLRAWVVATMAPDALHEARPAGFAQDLPAVSERLGSAAEVLGTASPAGTHRWTQGEAGGGCDPPVVLTDAIVQRLVTCEGSAVATASAEPSEVTWPMFRGRALDAFVEHVLFAGPVADATDALRSIWTARGSNGELASLDRFGASEEAASDLTELAAQAMAFSGTQRCLPRTEVRLGVTIEHVCELRGRADVLFGGPGTGLPAVLVEVKSGPLRDQHRAQLRHYVLLAALRHGEIPAGAALWSPVSGLEPLHLGGVLHSSAERVASAMDALGRLRAGEDPSLRPGTHCALCPARSGCRAASEHSATAEHSARSEHGVG